MKKLREGVSTGSCMTGGAEASVIWQTTGKCPSVVKVDTPIGKKLYLDIIPREFGVCGVVKDAGDDPQELLRFWTRKESYVKMTGEGMTKAFHTVDTLHGKYYKEIPLGTPKDRYLISVCTQEDRTCDFVCKMLD